MRVNYPSFLFLHSVELGLRIQLPCYLRLGYCPSVDSLSLDAVQVEACTVCQVNHEHLVLTHKRGGIVCTQDTQLLLWDLSMDEVVVPLRMAPVSGGSPSVLSTNQAAGWDGALHSAGPLRHAPARKEVPKLAPVMAHRVHAEPLSGLLFSKEAIVTACHEGHLKIWESIFLKSQLRMFKEELISLVLKLLEIFLLITQ